MLCTVADDWKRSEAEWTLYDDGIEERGRGERTAGWTGSVPDRWSADWFQKWNSILLVRWEILGT